MTTFKITPREQRMIRDKRKSLAAVNPVVRSMLDGYIEAVILESLPEGLRGTYDYSIKNFTGLAIKEAIKDLTIFYKKAEPLLADFIRGKHTFMVEYKWGEDFWCARNGLRSGFEDHFEYAGHGKELMKISKSFGEVSTYETDAGKIDFYYGKTKGIGVRRGIVNASTGSFKITPREQRMILAARRNKATGRKTYKVTSNFKDFLEGYLETAIWAEESNLEEELKLAWDEGIETEGVRDAREFHNGHFCKDAIRKATKDCKDFLREAEDILENEPEDDPSTWGHDFWLTRNGHGAGFWDGDYEKGKELTEIAKGYGEVNLTITNDGEIDFISM